MRVTVEDLAKLWSDAAGTLNEVDVATKARKEQLLACAADLKNVKFYHELFIDPETKRKWWKVL